MMKEFDSIWQIYDRFIDHFQTDTNSLEIEPIKITLLVVTAVQTKSGKTAQMGGGAVC